MTLATLELLLNTGNRPFLWVGSRQVTVGPLECVDDLTGHAVALKTHTYTYCLGLLNPLAHLRVGYEVHRLLYHGIRPGQGVSHALLAETGATLDLIFLHASFLHVVTMQFPEEA